MNLLSKGAALDDGVSEMLMKAEYKYFAFISYSRKDSRAAAFFHRKIEHFRIPTKYVAPERLPQNRKFAKPVFRDRRDLEARQNSFSEDIKRALETSRYLLVICSPNSAGSEWVEAEISHFLKTHGNDLSLVVPVILSGEPGSGSPDSECLPLSLRDKAIFSRNLPSMIPDAGEKEKDGWENGVIQSLSYLLQVSRERIRASVDAERVRQKRICATIGGVGLLLPFAVVLVAYVLLYVGRFFTVNAVHGGRFVKTLELPAACARYVETYGKSFGDLENDGVWVTSRDIDGDGTDEMVVDSGRLCGGVENLWHVIWKKYPTGEYRDIGTVYGDCHTFVPPLRIYGMPSIWNGRGLMCWRTDHYEQVCAGGTRSICHEMAGRFVAWLKSRTHVFEDAIGWSDSNCFVKVKIDGWGKVRGGFDIVMKLSQSNEMVVVQGISTNVVGKGDVTVMREFVTRADYAMRESMATLYLSKDGSLRCRAVASFGAMLAEFDSTMSFVVGAVVRKLAAGLEGAQLVCSHGVSPLDAVTGIAEDGAGDFDAPYAEFDDVLLLVKEWFSHGYYEMSRFPCQAKLSATSHYDVTSGFDYIRHCVKIGSWVSAECQHPIDFSCECWRPDEWFTFISDYNARQDKLALQMDVENRRAFFLYALPISSLRHPRSQERLDEIEDDLLSLPERAVWDTTNDIYRIISVR